MATRIIVGEQVKAVDLLCEYRGKVGVKVPQFSFARLAGNTRSIIRDIPEFQFLYCQKFIF